MISQSHIVISVVVASVSWLFWQIFCQYIVKSALDNIPGPPAKSFWAGVFPEVFNSNAWDFHTKMAEKYGSVIKIQALLGENQLYIFDPKALHHIFVKDQDIYEETASFIEQNKILFGPGLLGTLGDQHRKQRKMLNPVFSIAHLRDMAPTFYNVSYKLRDAFSSQVKNGPREVDLLSWMSRAALELIGQGGLGYSFDTLKEDSVLHPYSKSIKALVPTAFHLIFVRNFLLVPFTKLRAPKLMRILINILPWDALQRLRDIVDVMHATSVEIYESKKEALAKGDEAMANQIGNGKDIISILMKANMEASEVDAFSKEELLGQMSTLTFAATDTTSGALSRIFHLLSHHPEIQEKLRQEIVEARQKHDGEDLSYDDLSALPYLEAVVRETLRLYPTIPMVQRTTRQDVVLPLSAPIKGVDGREITEIPLPRNTNLIVGVIEANRNPEIWGADSLEWKPERWLDPLPDSVRAAHIPGVYSHLMTFLGGGRACIGFKFSQLEMKIILFLLLESFRFKPSGKEILWQMAGVATPMVKGETNNGIPRSQLPIIIERL